MKFRKIRPYRRLSMYLVNRPHAPSPTVGQTRVSEAPPFHGEGWVFPRPSDQQFDVSIRVPGLAPSATTVQAVLQDLSVAKGGVIRKLGYSFSQPHGYLQVRTTILINGAPPADYLFRTVDASSPTVFQGSFPPFQIGSPAGDGMADVFIKLPPSAGISVRFENASASESFSFFVRLCGWLFGE